MAEVVEGSVLERAAKAHWDAKRYSTSRTWEELKPEERTKAHRHMRAALEAIREPSEGMVEAGAGWHDHGGGTGSIGRMNAARNCREIWPAMLGAALSE